MGKIVVSEFISLDGVIEDPGGGGFRHAGWTFEFETGEDGQKFKFDEVMSSDALLLGRVTYEEFATAWPTMEGTGEFGERMNGMPKYVVSSTLKSAEWQSSTVLDGELAEEMAGLKQDLAGSILVNGSAQLVQGLLELDLVDELRLMVFPVVLGEGKRLFGTTTDKKRLRLTSSTTLGDASLLIFDGAGR
jgi:dihydrofolate reductase